MSESDAPGPVCSYCGALLGKIDDYTSDDRGSYHWSCAHPMRPLKRAFASIEMLTQAHVQHRSSDQQFLRSLSSLTETVQRLEERLAKLEKEKRDGA
jgi:hypothetical protein